MPSLLPGACLWKASLVGYGEHTLKIGYQQTPMTGDRSWLTNGEDRGRFLPTPIVIPATRRAPTAKEPPEAGKTDVA